jgi:hypothetical protein
VYYGIGIYQYVGGVDSERWQFGLRGVFHWFVDGLRVVLHFCLGWAAGIRGVRGTVLLTAGGLPATKPKAI